MGRECRTGLHARYDACAILTKPLILTAASPIPDTMKKILFAASFTLAFFAVLPAPTFAANEAADATTFEKTLANGLRVIVKEDRRAPTVVHMVWYRAGAMDEKDGTSGVAHALEHLMFKGTKNAEGRRVQQARGGSGRA